ncbi:MAG: hypothetical protein ABSA39_04550 [Edaphobacter sp.]
MAIFQNLPASVRFGPPASQENRGVSTTDRRPYLITVPPRRSAVATRQTVTTARQFFALFPHESEDARITGATRSLYRRLLALNLPRPVARAESPAELREVGEVRSTYVGTRIA